jgi:hypothetical protein
MNYILYGAASIGNIAKESLEKSGFSVIGYIDKRAFELSSYNDLPVWSLEDIPKEYINSKTCVFISVKNVFEHEEIAEKLLEKGFQNVIYKPYSVLLGYGTDSEYRLAELYEELFLGKCIEEITLPPMTQSQILHDFALIRDENSTITANIPLEFVFTNDYQNGGMQKWGNVCILAFFTHINFFRFLNNQEDAKPDDYLQEYCVFTAKLQGNIQVTDAWKNNVLENRTQIYEQMKAAMDLDPDFFIRNAAEARWNDSKKYFNLISGKHRATFQAALGKKYIPLKISKEDYDLFLHSNEIKTIMQLLRETKQELLVPHPYFYRGMFIKDRSEQHFLSWFARYYGEKLYRENNKICFEKLKIMDFSEDFGNFARFCKRLGCKVQRITSQGLLELQLNKLCYAEDIIYDKRINSENNIIIIEANIIESIEDQRLKLLLDKIDIWIVKYATSTMMEKWKRKFDFQVVAKINMKWQKNEILKSYLLEKYDNESNRK